MASKLSILSWNVEHFKKPRKTSEFQRYTDRVKRISEAIRAKDPDVMAIYEVEGQEAFRHLRQYFPNYTFHITEGPQVQEILVAVRSNLSAFFTQRLEFKSGSSYLRPGALITITKDDTDFPILFLHTKSGDDPKGFGLRDDMLSRAIKFRKVLNKAAADPNGANYIFMGDLNTMGMKYPYQRSIDFSLELKRADTVAKRYYSMRRLTKSFIHTYSNGSKSKIPKSDLDHVYAAKHLRFVSQNGSDVLVGGWVESNSDEDQDLWIRDYSDHAYLYMEVEA